MLRILGVSKPIIGMVHLKKLPGQRGHRGIDYVIGRAIQDVLILQRGGVNAICLENWEDESTSPFVSYQTGCYLEAIAREVANNTQIPFGLNILPNDYKVAFKIAKNFWAQYGQRLCFVWLDVMVDYVKTDLSYSKVSSFKVKVDLDDLKKCRQECPGVVLFTSIHPKHYILLEQGKTLEESSQQAILNGADAIVITKATGIAPDKEALQRVKMFIGEFPVLLGSGLTPENATALLPLVDGAIVGTAFKDKNFNRVLENKVKELMAIVKKLRGEM